MIDVPASSDLLRYQVRTQNGLLEGEHTLDEVRRLTSDDPALGRLELRALGDDEWMPLPMVAVLERAHRSEGVGPTRNRPMATPRGDIELAASDEPIVDEAGIDISAIAADRAEPSISYRSAPPDSVAAALISVLGWVLGALAVAACLWFGTQGNVVAAVAAGLGGLFGVGLMLVLAHLTRLQEEQRWLQARSVEQLERLVGRLAREREQEFGDPGEDGGGPGR